MEIEELLQFLTLAELHVADGQRQIAQQRILLQRLEGEGADTTACRALLNYLIQIQTEQCEDRDKIVRDVVKRRQSEL